MFMVIVISILSLNRYYFYFALENAVCNNYITEKYWKRFTFDSVPIVLNRTIYTDVDIPNSSFIAIDDFKTSKQMTDYLHYFIKNPSEYLKYFEYRKENITVVPDSENDLNNGFCALCSKIRHHIEDNKVIEHVNPIYEDINKCIPKKAMLDFANNW
uniref:Fucosyltransferase n=1 Tax=Strongyloides papillosus TaxID=174720 RepID=A0A0N5C070_STREA